MTFQIYKTATKLCRVELFLNSDVNDLGEPSCLKAKTVQLTQGYRWLNNLFWGQGAALSIRRPTLGAKRVGVSVCKGIHNEHTEKF